MNCSNRTIVIRSGVYIPIMSLYSSTNRGFDVVQIMVRMSLSYAFFEVVSHRPSRVPWLVSGSFLFVIVLIEPCVWQLLNNNQSYLIIFHHIPKPLWVPILEYALSWMIWGTPHFRKPPYQRLPSLTLYGHPCTLFLQFQPLELFNLRTFLLGESALSDK